MAKKIGLLGGTFDPVHIGHLCSAIEVVEQLGLDELRLIPNALPPHRATPTVTAQDRLAMVKLAVNDIDALIIDDRELKRDQPSYTFDTLCSIRQELQQEDQLFFVMGLDAFYGLPTWYRWQELLNYCHILVLQRAGVSVKIPNELQVFLTKHLVQDASLLENSCGQIAYIQQSPLDISSTHIRYCLEQAKSVRFLVPDVVLDYIKRHQLY